MVHATGHTKSTGRSATSPQARWCIRPNNLQRKPRTRGAQFNARDQAGRAHMAVACSVREVEPVKTELEMARFGDVEVKDFAAHFEYRGVEDFVEFLMAFPYMIKNAEEMSEGMWEERRG